MTNEYPSILLSRTHDVAPVLPCIVPFDMMAGVCCGVDERKKAMNDQGRHD